MTGNQRFTSSLYANSEDEKPIPCPYCNKHPYLSSGFIDMRIVCPSLHPHRLGPARRTIRGAVSSWNKRALKIINRRKD